MARIIYRALLRRSIAPSLLLRSPQFALSPSTSAFTCRSRSTLSGKAQLIEIDVESSSSSSASSSSSWPSSLDSDFEVKAIRKLEDIVQRVIVQRSTPDWLPFVPGSSFWVPPRRSDSLKMIDLVGKLAEPLSEEESLSLTTSRGWPCSDFLTRGSDSGTGDSPQEEVEVEVEVEVDAKVQPNSHSE